MKNIKIDGETLSFESLGIEILSRPEQIAHAGAFQLPPEFDSKRYAAEWVPEDQVHFKEQRQLMPGVGMTVPGLEVWKGNEKKKAVVIVLGGNKRYVLMHRALKLQKVMNSLYGNVTKELHNMHVRGDVITNLQDQANQDSGMIPEQKLRPAGQGSPAEVEESLMPLNKTPELSEADAVST